MLYDIDLVSDIFIVYPVFFVSIFFDFIGEKLIFLTLWLSHEMLVRNVSFSENCVYVLNEWFLVSWFWILKSCFWMQYFMIAVAFIEITTLLLMCFWTLWTYTFPDVRSQCLWAVSRNLFISFMWNFAQWNKSETWYVKETDCPVKLLFALRWAKKGPK